VIRDLPAAKAAMRGVVPATIGLSLSLAVQMAQSPLAHARREGAFSVVVHVGMLGGAALLFAAWHVSPVLVLALAGIGGAFLLGEAPLALRRFLSRRLR
jgi:chromate transport protein ChrA